MVWSAESLQEASPSSDTQATEKEEREVGEKKEPNGPFVGRCLPEQMHMVISMTLYDLTEVCVP